MSNKIICPMTLSDVTMPYHECVPECALLIEVTNGLHAYKTCAVTALALAANNGMCMTASPVNIRVADKPDTFHDNLYDCKSVMDAGEDNREKLEADIRKKQREWSQSPYSLDTNTDEVLGWLDRQAAITEREMCKGVV